MATREELEAAIDANPHDDETFFVFGDWLQDRGDPRGELIGLQRADCSTAEVRIVVMARETRLQSDLGPSGSDWATLGWHCGFVRSLRGSGRESDAPAVREMFAHPSLRHMTSVDFYLDEPHQWFVDLIAEAQRPCWRRLEIHPCLEPRSGAIDLSNAWRALPRITSVRVEAGRLALGEIRSTTLEELALYGRVQVSQLAPVFAGSTPKLRRLSVDDLDLAAFATALESSSLGAQLEGLELPADPSPDLRDRILARCPSAMFPDWDE